MARILIVDDEPNNQRILNYTLKKAGYETMTAADGNAALSLLRANTPDLAIVDVAMPVMGGFTAAKLIRRSEAGTNRHIPIIAVTANAVSGVREMCLESGVDDFVSKPVALADVSATGLLAGW